MPRIVYEWITGEYNPPQNDSHNSRLQNWERQGGTPSSWRNSTTRLKQCVTFTKSVELRIKLLELENEDRGSKTCYQDQRDQQQTTTNHET